MSSEACHLCGHEAAIVIQGIAWCASCAHARGSCCHESEMEECEEPPREKTSKNQPQD